MKKLLVGIACAAISCAHAAGPYDGIYQSNLAPGVYASVHQNGNLLFVATLGTTPLNNVTFWYGGYPVQPAAIENWVYSFGSISGSKSRVTGPAIYGACTVTSDLSFDGAGTVSAAFVSVANTTFGNQQGVNCSALYSTIFATLGTTTLTFRRIF